MYILPRGKDKVKNLGPQTCFDFQLATDWVEKSPRLKKCSLAYSEREENWMQQEPGLSEGMDS